MEVIYFCNLCFFIWAICNLEDRQKHLLSSVLRVTRMHGPLGIIEQDDFLGFAYFYTAYMLCLDQE
jgi:hypothetical protein